MYLIIAAMKEEREALLALAEEVRPLASQPVQLFQARLAGQDILVCESGIGKVEAAFTTTYVCSHYPVQGLINIGSAGGLKPYQKVGDIVVATQCTYHDMYFYFYERRKNMERYTFDCDSKWTEKMSEVLEAEGLPHELGLLVTGDQFIQVDEQIDRILEDCPKAVAVEMEATAIAQVGKRLGLPTLVFRGLSDITHKIGNELDFQAYLPLASARAAKACEAFLNLLPKA